MDFERSCGSKLFVQFEHEMCAILQAVEEGRCSQLYNNRNQLASTVYRSNPYIYHRPKLRDNQVEALNAEDLSPDELAQATMNEGADKTISLNAMPPQRRPQPEPEPQPEPPKTNVPAPPRLEA